MITQEEKKIILSEIWRLNKKADQNRSFHGDIIDKIRLRNKIFNLYITIGTAISATLIFAKIPDTYFLPWGIFSATIFIVSLLPKTLNLEKSLENRVLVLNLLGKWIRDAQNFGNIEILVLDKENAIKRQKKLIEQYKDIMDKAPSIPNRVFLKSKQKHLQKIEISKMLDKYPFEKISEIKKRLRNANENTATN